MLVWILRAEQQHLGNRDLEPIDLRIECDLEAGPDAMIQSPRYSHRIDFMRVKSIIHFAGNALTADIWVLLFVVAYGNP